MSSNIELKKRQVLEELKVLELRAEFLKGRLAALEELEGGAPRPAGSDVQSRTVASSLLHVPPVGVGEAIRQGMKALGQFTKADVIEWVRLNHPRLEFSQKSWGRPLRELMERGEVVLLRHNMGNKSQAVYGFKRGGG